LSETTQNKIIFKQIFWLGFCWFHNTKNLQFELNNLMWLG